MESNFSRQVDKGLYQLVRNVWRSKIPDFWQSFQGQTPSEQSFSYEVSQGTAIDFYYDADSVPLRASYGSAACRSGTVSFVLYRDGSKVMAKQIAVTATIEDVYDFDFTRDSASLSISRKAATVQIGWQLPDRTAGRIFHTDVHIDITYTPDTTYPQLPPPIHFFNNYGYIKNGQEISPPVAPPDGGGGSN